MKKINLIIPSILFTTASILGGILFLFRYSCLWFGFPALTFWWKVYLDHFMAGFLMPIWIFIILGGVILLFHRQVNLRNQKMSAFLGFIAIMTITLIWDFLIPFYLLIKVVIQNNYGFFAFVGAIKLFYWAPRYEFIQFLFDWAGILAAILFIKSFRRDLK